MVRCDRCFLVQFPTINNLCRRCKLPLDEEPEPEAATALAGPSVTHDMQSARTYISKIENQKATPTLSSLARLAKALGVDVTELLAGEEMARQDEVRELLEDRFIGEVAPFAAKLDSVQRQGILAQVRELAFAQQRCRIVPVMKRATRRPPSLTAPAS